jgi:RNA polymerase sigma factor (TIGR02999 family)
VSTGERAHFFSLVARAMRQIIIDHARRCGAGKRGGELRRIPFDESDIAVEEEAESLLALDGALLRLAALDPRLVQIVECRYFAGLTEEETASTLGVGLRTVQRDWLRAIISPAGCVRPRPSKSGTSAPGPIDTASRSPPPSAG